MIAAFLAVYVQAVADPYEVGLGSWSTEVAALIPGRPMIQKARSLGSDETWNYDSGVEVFFCRHRVTSVRIPMASTLRSWAAAVAKEQAERGPAELDTGMSSVGSIAAKWRLRSGGYLSLDIQDVGGVISANRWLEFASVCAETGANLPL